MTYKVLNNTVIDDNKNIILNTISHTTSTVSPSGGTLTLDLTAASYFKVDSLSSNITTINITNAPVTYAMLFVLELAYATDSALAITWPGSFRWADNIAPVIVPVTGKKDVFVFFSTDNGASWNSFIAGQNL